ncbi:MAG: dihydrolipoyl dehydrogenase [Chitinispirillaceae bacterium]|nr:dihydrolipoyl dehydrogenase [Chitinispirillaceae bacterium]
MYDLIILGGGPAGYLAAQRAVAAGLSTALVEKGHLGGVCLNEGCIPSKTLLHCSKLYAQARSSQAFGVTVTGANFDLGAAMARKAKIVETLRNGIAFSLKKQKVAIEAGPGLIVPKQGERFRVQVADRVLEGARLLICTGSEPVRLPLPGADQPFVLTNREILSIDRIPRRLVVIGGGAIGLEFATFFSEAGSSVTVVELLPGIGGAIDVEIAQALRRELEKKGVRFMLESRVTSIGGHEVAIECNGQSETVGADIVLMSVGRRPITAGIGLEQVGVAVANGAITTDGRGRTNVAGVWAAGDVNGISMLAHTAFREAEVCVNDMRGAADQVNYDAIPWVIYTHPEVAAVGLTEAAAEKRGIPVAGAKLPLSYNGRYLAENDGGRGFCKAVVDKKSSVLLGVHLLGSGVSEIIHGAAMMVEKKMTAEEIGRVVFPHPTVSEIIRDTINQIV